MATARAALAPSPIRSSVRGPRAGSVTFWLATHPRPPGHRRNAPRPRAMRRRPRPRTCRFPRSGRQWRKSQRRIRNDGDHVDFDQPFRPGQGRDDESGRDRVYTLQPVADYAVHWLAVARIDDVDRDLTDVLEFRARLAQEHVDVRHRPLGLAGWIADRDAVACLEILTDLATNKHHGPARHNRLAQVVVKLLLGIGVLGVELAQPLVGGHPAHPRSRERRQLPRIDSFMRLAAPGFPTGTVPIVGKAGITELPGG